MSYWVDEFKTKYVTCCYPVEIALPPGCNCAEYVIHVYEVEPCTWTVTMLFFIDSDYLPITVNFGDGTSGVFNSIEVIHDFPDPGFYNVCYTYEAMPGDTLTCCEQVYIPGCCLNAYFELNQAISSPSCINPEYTISHVACPFSIVSATHIWEYSDGTVYYGAYPPDHLFTNFVNTFGQVCVTHTIICCEDTASYTACADHLAGAWLGHPNELQANPGWKSAHAGLLAFENAHATGFVGQSETLKRNWQALLHDIADHQAAQEPLHLALDSLTNLAQLWIEAMHADTSLVDSLYGLLAQKASRLRAVEKLVRWVPLVGLAVLKDSRRQLFTEYDFAGSIERHLP